MKNIVKIAFLAAIALAASCNRQVPENVADFDDSLITFTTRTAETRATEVTTANLTSFNVIATTGTTTQSSVWTDGVFSGSQGGNYTGGKYWPASQVTWNFYAANAAINFVASGSTITVQNCNTDIVADYIEGAGYKTTNALTFEHILAQVGTVTMKAPAGYTVTELKVSLNPVYTGTYNIKANTWTRGSAASAAYVVGTASTGVSINTAGGSFTSNDNDLWLVPGQYELTASYRIAKGDFNQTYTKHATVTLLQGYNNNLGLPNGNDPNIPDPGNDISDIIFTVSVTPWDTTTITANFN